MEKQNWALVFSGVSAQGLQISARDAVLERQRIVKDIVSSFTLMPIVPPSERSLLGHHWVGTSPSGWVHQWKHF